MALGKKIREIREQKGLSQDQLSVLTGWTEENPNIGVSQGAISALEKRDSESSKHAPALAAALGVDLNNILIDDYWKKSNNLQSPKKEITDSIVEDIAELKRLSPRMAEAFRLDLKSAIQKELAKKESTKDERDIGTHAQNSDEGHLDLDLSRSVGGQKK
jgi:transcriptional regulator with XRE-family HTH domain